MSLGRPEWQVLRREESERPDGRDRPDWLHLHHHRVLAAAQESAVGAGGQASVGRSASCLAEVEWKPRLPPLVGMNDKEPVGARQGLFSPVLAHW